MKIANPTAKLGEDKASLFLHKNGFKIIERNFRKSYGEIDIIGIDSSTDPQRKILVFIEVKTRKSNSFGSPLEAVTPGKLKSVIKLALFYKLIHPNLPDAMRIDAISVVLSSDNRVENIEHIKNISV